MVQTKRPRITVGIPCYNAETTIVRAVQCAVVQDWPELEIVVVDDCSSDGSVSLIEGLSRSDSRVRLVRHERNAGAGGARYTIVAEATGEFIAFFDDDDESVPARLKVQHRYITDYEQRTGADLVGCYASGSRVYPNGYQLKLGAIGSRPGIPLGEDVADYLLFNRRRPGLFYGAGTPTCAFMARKKTILEAGGFDRTFRRVEDVDFAVRLALQGGHFIGCPENLFTQWATMAADKSAKANFDAEMRLFEKHRDYLFRKNRYHYARNWFRFRYHHFNREPLKALATLLTGWLRNPVLVTRHFVYSAPGRLLHELRMNRKRNYV